MSENASRRGTWVIVRTFGAKARRVRVWEEDEDAVWVVSDEAYKRRTAELDAPDPIGFRRDAVFEDAPKFFDEFGYDVPSSFFWEKLTPYEFHYPSADPDTPLLALLAAARAWRTARETLNGIDAAEATLLAAVAGADESRKD